MRIGHKAPFWIIKPEQSGSEQVLKKPFSQKIGHKFNFPQPPAEVKGRCRHQGINFIPNKSFQVVFCHPVILFGVAKDWFDGRPSPEPYPCLLFSVGRIFWFGRRRGMDDRPIHHFPATVPTVNRCFFGPYPCNLLVKVKGLFQGIPIIRVAFEGNHRNNHVGSFGNGKRHFGAKLILLVVFAFGNAAYLRFSCRL